MPLLLASANNMQTAYSQFNTFESLSDIISALQNILLRSQVIIPVLETPYSRVPNIDHYTVGFERQSVINIIAERQQQLNTVLHEISGLETVMDSVKNIYQQVVEKKEKIIQSMNLHKGLVSSLWRLPTEILSQIFNYCLPEIELWSLSAQDPTEMYTDHLPETERLRPSVLKAPILLTGICRRWREVAVGAPDLWCRLYVERDDRDWEQAALGYDLWLKRSRGRPLTVTLGHHRSTKIRSLLQPYMNHVTSLRLSHPHGDHPFVTDLPALQELTIRGWSCPDIARSIWQLPSTMRSLHIISIRSFFNIEHLSSFSSALAQLTDVQIALYHLDTVLHLLQLCPNLSSLTLRVQNDQQDPLNSFMHTKIQTFRFVTCLEEPSCLSGLLNVLSLPNLRAFEARQESFFPHEDMKAFLARSKCPLETLTVSSRVRITDAQRAEYVSFVPSLVVVVDRIST
ncbi:uncharacterized protein EDB93DRAFT_19331 [Suillus bovinus]|uniref:uncharacterized protein n=1 Tax=Suillus bovinus TaxID=48563 RepID=UPI001B868433|nr:uncharacterized protein EDB93DRAFT_19331 [Suillus bovinus]KAG2159828.1 hypothetical protein EDB93DRAFT_19331 [Suillus bovinus]